MGNWSLLRAVRPAAGEGSLEPFIASESSCADLHIQGQTPPVLRESGEGGMFKMGCEGSPTPGLGAGKLSQTEAMLEAAQGSSPALLSGSFPR